MMVVVVMMLVMMMEVLMITTTPWRKTQLCIHSVTVSLLSVGESPAKRKTRGISKASDC